MAEASNLAGTTLATMELPKLTGCLAERDLIAHITALQQQLAVVRQSCQTVGHGNGANLLPARPQCHDLSVGEPNDAVGDTAAIISVTQKGLGLLQPDVDVLEPAECRALRQQTAAPY